MTNARYIMVGGFLGAGKTTALARLARFLTDGGLRVGLITNDQGAGLVDTRSLRSQGHAVEEIAGGCFCCRFESLLAAARRLDASTRPDVILAEPVGSCTDLVATVSYPLRRIYGHAFRIAPLSVLVDPLRALRVFGLEPGRTFSPKVLYVYRKQLEEAGMVVINKCDLLEGEQLSRLRARLEEEYPRAAIHQVSARRGDGLEEWFAALLEADQAAGEAPDIDYALYGEGEALLGWLNATLVVAASGEEGLEANDLCLELARALSERLETAGAPLAHLKLTLAPGARTDALLAATGALAQVHVAREGAAPERTSRLPERVTGAEAIVNLRAQAAPEVLERHFKRELDRLAAAGRRAAAPWTVALEHLECFRPGQPVPVHRIAAFP